MTKEQGTTSSPETAASSCSAGKIMAMYMAS